MKNFILEFKKFFDSMVSFSQYVEQMRHNPIVFYVTELKKEYDKLELPIRPDEKTIKKILRKSKILDYLLLNEKYESNVYEYCKEVFERYTYLAEKPLVTFCEYCEHRSYSHCKLQSYFIKYNDLSGKFNLIAANNEYSGAIKENRNNCKYFKRRKSE